MCVRVLLGMAANLRDVLQCAGVALYASIIALGVMLLPALLTGATPTLASHTAIRLMVASLSRPEPPVLGCRPDCFRSLDCSEAAGCHDM